ncbi:MAG: hypothetical protein ISS34_04230 [Candidatus Omnitrophica bacterium]|nr:hypothetical protein [Candidatus Omnitrophota bacterium]
MNKYFIMSKNPLFKEKKDKEDRKGHAVNKKSVIIAAVVVPFIVAAIAVAGYIISRTPKPLQKVSVAQSENGDYQLLLGGRPYFIKGVCYIPTPIGKGYDYDVWTDSNEPWLTDGKLMKDMGINTVRFYFHTKNAESGRKVIRTFYELYGIRSALGHYLDFWKYPPPNYARPEIRARIKEEVIQMVKDYKDEPGVLFWILGNENNYSFDRNVNPWTTDEIEAIENPRAKREAKARIYYTFVNDLAKAIKEIDPNHPVVMGNGELASIETARELCADIDILGGIVYTGRTFGTFWKRLKRNFGKPAVMIEYGCDRYDGYNKKEDEDHQALFLQMLCQEIVDNSAGKKGEGNSLGGFIFEWNDEWWKYDEQRTAGWKRHDAKGSWANSAYYYDAKIGTNMNEEWWGIVGLTTEGGGAINKRVPKKAYYILKKFWRK